MTATKQNDLPPVKRRSEKQIAWSRQLAQNSQKFKKEKKREKELHEKRKEKELQENIKLPDIKEINEEIVNKENTNITKKIIQFY
jgi:hypothetical protein